MEAKAKGNNIIVIINKVKMLRRIPFYSIVLLRYNK